MVEGGVFLLSALWSLGSSEAKKLLCFGTAVEVLLPIASVAKSRLTLY